MVRFVSYSLPSSPFTRIYGTTSEIVVFCSKGCALNSFIASRALQTVHSCKVEEVVGEGGGVGIGFI
ncbi:unnamed protein product [Rhizophagus irregularis]|nr:unnamed protein product [Rhizophagus irregularis]